MKKQGFLNKSEYTKNLKHSSFFDFNHINFNHSLILNMFHHLQLLCLAWTNSSLIIYLKNGFGSFSLSELLSYFLFINNRRDIQINLDYVVKGIISTAIIIYTIFYPLRLIFHLRTRQSYPNFMSKSYYYAKYSSLFALAIMSFNFYLELFLDCLDKYQLNSAYIVPIIFIAIGIMCLFIGSSIMLILLVPIKTLNPFSRINNSFITSTLLHKFFISALIIICSWNGSLGEKSIISILTVLNFIASIYSVSSLVWKGSFIHFKTIYLTSSMQAAVMALCLTNTISLLETDFLDLKPTKIFFEFLVLSVLIQRILWNKIDRLKMGEVKIQKDSKSNIDWENIRLLNFFRRKQEFTRKNFAFKNPHEHFLFILHEKTYWSHTFMKQTIQSCTFDTKVILAYHYFNEFHDFYNSYNLCHGLLSSQEASLKVKIGALFILDRIEKSFEEINKQEANLRMRDYFSYQEHYEIFEAKIFQLLDNYTKLFMLLQDKKPCLYKISKLSEDIQEKLMAVKSYWKIIESSYNKIPISLLQLYSITLEKLMIEHNESNMIQNIMKNMLKAIIKDKKNLDTLDDENKISLFVSIEKNSHGKIMCFSKSAYQLGYSHAELFERNFGSIFPSILNSHIQNLLTEIQNKEFNLGKIKEGFIFLLHKNSHLVPSIMKSQFMINQNLGFGLGIIIELQKNYRETLLLDENSNIAGATLNLKAVVGNQIKLFSTNLEILEEFLRKKAEEIFLQDKNFVLFTPRDLIKTMMPTYNIQKKELKFGVTTIEILQICENNYLQTQEVDKSFTLRESVDSLQIAAEDIDTFAGKKKKVNLSNLEVPITKKHLTHIFESDDSHLGNEENEKISLSKNKLKNKMTSNGRKLDLQSISSRSEQNSRNLFVWFESLQKQLKFYKFNYSHILFLFFLVFLVLFAITILLSYFNGMDTYNEVTTKVTLMVNFNKRNIALLDTVGNIWSYDIIQNYLTLFLLPNVTSLYLYGIQLAGLNSIEQAISISTSVQQALNDLDDIELKKKIYTKNIRIFYGTISGPNETDSTQVLDNLKATSEILSMMSLCLRRISNTGPQITQMKNLIYADMFNDYQIQNEQIQLHIYESMRVFLNSVNDLNDMIYLIALISFIVYSHSAILVMWIYYKDSMNYLRTFTAQPIEDLKHRAKEIEALKAAINKGPTDYCNQNFKEEINSLKFNKCNLKQFSTKRLLFHFLALRLLVLILLLAPSIFLLAFCYRFSYTNYYKIITQAKNMLKLNQISMKTFSLYHMVTLNDVLVNNLIARNKYAREFLDDYIVEIREMISVSEINDDQVNSMLSKSLCLYYNYIGQDCESSLNGVAKQGARGFIYSMTDLYANERSSVRGKTYDLYTALGFVTRPYRTDLYALTVFGLIPACMSFINQLEYDLLDFLQANIDDIVISFVFSLIIDLGSLVVVCSFLYVILDRERKKLIYLMNLLPLEFVMKNTELRMFLIKDNRNFLSLFKKAEVSLGIVSALNRKSK